MSETDDTNAVARERADKSLDAAVGELRAAAHKIGLEHEVPEGIAGHSIEELLGRITYIPSMARELRRAAGQAMAKGELRKLFDQAAQAPDGAGKKPEAPATIKALIEPSKIPANIPVGRDVQDLDGITVQTVKALKAAGLATVGDVVTVPDEHLVKLSGLGEKSVVQIRAAIARASSAGTT